MSSSQQDQEKAIDFNDPNQRFHITAELANTLQGRIYASTDRKTKKFTVIKETWKQLVKTGMSRDQCPVPEDFFEEKRILNLLSSEPNSHPHFVHIITEWEEPLTYNYAMEGCQGGDLFDFVKNKHLSHLKAHRASMFQSNRKHYSKHCLPNNTKDKWINDVRNMFRQLVDCMSWMQDRGICHLDMSLENTMVYNADKCLVKIIDFGLAKECDIKNNNWKNNKRVGKRGYMAPEVYGKQTYDCRAADIWSLGVMLYMMLIGAPPYELPVVTCVPFKYLVNQRLKEMLTHWKRLHYVTEDIIDLLRRIFRSEHKRITMDKIKKHPFVGLHIPLYPPIGLEMKENTNQEIENNYANQLHLAPGDSSNNKNNRKSKPQKMTKASQSYETVGTATGSEYGNDSPPQLAVNSSGYATSQQSQSSAYTISQQSTQTETPKQTPVIAEQRTGAAAQASTNLDGSSSHPAAAGAQTQTQTQIQTQQQTTIVTSTTADMTEPSADPPEAVYEADAAGNVAKKTNDDLESETQTTRNQNGCIH